MTSLLPPLVDMVAIDRGQLNACLVDWQHTIGPLCRPPYALEAIYALREAGQPVAVVAFSETVRETIGNTRLRREEVVELSRLCAVRPRLCRVMLRLATESLFPSISRSVGRPWLISYQDEGAHSGDTYRFDGWCVIGGGGRGGPDSRSGRPGRKLKMWGWPPAVADEVELRRDLPRSRPAPARPRSPVLAELPFGAGERS